MSDRELNLPQKEPFCLGLEASRYFGRISYASFFQVATTSTLPKRNHLKHGWKTTFLFGTARFQVLSQSFLAYIQDSSSYRLWFQRFLLFPLFVYHIFTHLHTCAKMMQSDAIFFQVIHTTHQAGFVLLDG